MAHISAYDASTGMSSSSVSDGGGGGGAPIIRAANIVNLDVNSSSHGVQGTYADDDSAVSSEVTDDGEDESSSEEEESESSSDGIRQPEVPILSREAAADIENAVAAAVARQQIQQVQQLPPPPLPPPPEEKGILPRDRRVSCFLLVATCLLVVAVAVGTGLGIFFMSRTNNNDNDGGTTVERGGPGSGPIDNKDSLEPDDGGNSSAIFSPTYSPAPSTATASPVGQFGQTIGQGNNNDNWQLPPLVPDDLASHVVNHVINEEISTLTSFSDLGGDNGGDGSYTTLTAQQRARDFLVLRDTLPLMVNDDNENGDDDPLAIYDNNAVPKRRPYLKTTTPSYRVAQRFAAAVLYYATDGSNWENKYMWLEPGVHECDFIGVTCQDLPIPAITLEEALQDPTNDELPRVDGRLNSVMERMIVAIDLPENNIAGYIPREIVALPYLERLGLWSNKISGSIPSQIGNLSRLSTLHLDDNALTGKIPSQLGQLLEMMDLSLGLNTGITGRIPPELGNLYNLERLRLSDMSLRGSIPPSIGNLRNLIDLYLQNNKLGRALPEELKNLTNLQTLILSDNAFTGEVPASWARELVNLKRLEIQENEMKFDAEQLCSLLNGGDGDGGEGYNVMDENSSFGSSRTNVVGGGGLFLEALVADCQGMDPKVSCSCCTSCLP